MKKFMVVLPFTLFVASSWPGPACAEGPPSSETEKLGYAIGYQVGDDFHRDALPLDVDRLLEGLRSALEDTTPRLSPEEMRAALEWLQEQNAAAQKSGADAEREASDIAS